MADDREPRAGHPRPISGGSIQEADLSAAPDVAWRAADHSESPFVQGLRRLRKSTTALIGAGIVAVLLMVALFADVLAPQSPIASDQTHTFERPSRDYPLGTDQWVMVGKDKHDRILITHEAASENGEDARQLLQRFKDCGLKVTAACSDDSQSLTEAITAV